MEQDRLEEIAQEIVAKHNNKDSLFGEKGVLKALTASVLEAALNGELTKHLGYTKHQRTITDNARNGHSPKKIKTEQGELPIQVPRDRQGSFEPQLIKKHQNRFDGLDDKVIALYAKGMSVADIQEQIRELYNIEIATSLVSTITDSVLEEVQAWQNRPLDRLYPIVYMDCLVVKVRENKQIINKAVYLALGVNDRGHKELLGMWIGYNEGAKFWLNVLNELKNRGLEDIFIACLDGLTGFPEAIEAVYPQREVQLCIVHMVCNSLKYVSWGQRRKIASLLKGIYTASTEESACLALESFKEQQGKDYRYIYENWRKNWDRLAPLFSYPPEIRRSIYTTNAIESLNMSLGKVLKNKRVFPNDASVLKILYLACERISRRWSMPIVACGKAMSYFMLRFEERINL